jgi:hypothetical protein
LLLSGPRIENTVPKKNSSANLLANGEFRNLAVVIVWTLNRLNADPERNARLHRAQISTKGRHCSPPAK